MKANQEWFTALELAGMPGMPGSARGVLKKCTKQMYVSRQRAYGKGLEYALNSLPAMTQAYLKDVTAADEKYRGFKQKEAVAHVDSAQVAINKIAAEINAMGEMALFKGWLQIRQDIAQQRMGCTTGDEFTGYAGDFILFVDAAQVVARFEREARG